MAITFSPASWTFGNRPVSSSQTVTVTATNDGNAAVNIAAQAGDISWSATSVPAANGSTSGTATITVTFAPSSTGNKSATIRGGAATCDLSGVGIDPSQEATPETGYSDDPDTTAEDAILSRLRFHVPSWDTELTMGKGAVGSNQTYDGFGIQTEGRIFANADSNVLMQSCGDMILQAYGSDQSFYALAGDEATLAGVTSANVISQKGVTISAGFGDLTLTEANGDRENLAAEDADSGIDAVKDQRSAAGVVLGVCDGMVATASALRATINMVKSAAEHGKRRKIAQYCLGGFGAAVAATGAVMSFGGAAGAGWLGGTTIFGAGGVLLASPAFSGFYSASGLVLMSAFPFMGGIDAEVFGFHSAGLTGWVTASVHGNRAASLDSNGHVKISASGSSPGPYSGTISLDAAKVVIGAPHNWATAPTLATAEKIHMTTLAKSSELVLDNMGKSVFVRADTNVSINVGDFWIAVTTDGISIGKAQGAPPILKLDANNFELAAQKILMGDQANGQVTVDNGKLKLTGTALDLM